MPKRIRREPEPDVNQLAHHLVKMSTEEKGPVEVQAPLRSEISRVMAAMGRKGGKIGGKRRAARMTEEQRSNAAAMAARARWARVKAESRTR
jgi:DNA polymerase IIIc chi subunit